MTGRLSSSPLVRVVFAGVGLLAAGCGSESASSDTSSSTPLLAGRTEGGPDVLWDHVERLGVQFGQTEPKSPDEARAGLRAYINAVDTTTDAIISDKTATPELRKRAVETKLTVLSRAKDSDPQQLQRFLAATDRVEALGKGTDMAGYVAFVRVMALGESMETAPMDEKTKWFDRLADAVLRLAKTDPPHPNTPEVLSTMALKCEVADKPDRAREMYTILAEKFADSPHGKFANGSVYRLALKGKPLDDFKGPGLDGKPIDIKDFRGKVVLIDFWGTWCGPCVQEMPHLKELRELLGTKDFEILGVCLDERASDAIEFLQAKSYTWPHLHFPIAEGKEIEVPLAVRFGAEKIPLKLLVDRDGHLITSGFFLQDLEPTLQKLFPKLGDTPAQLQTKKRG